MKSKLKLEQGQIWKQGDVYFRIVKWTRLSIDYKVLKNLSNKEGTLHAVTKKEFCRLIKGATLLTPELFSEIQAEHAEGADPIPAELAGEVEVPMVSQAATSGSSAEASDDSAPSSPVE